MVARAGRRRGRDPGAPGRRVLRRRRAPARTTTGRSPTGLVVGDTVRCPVAPRLLQPARPARRCGRRRSTRSPAGASSGRATRCSSARSWPEPDAGERRSPPRSRRGAVVIVGGGAAGLAAADMLRREGYDGTPHDDQRGRLAARTTGRTSPRTSSRARRPTTGSRCAPPEYYARPAHRPRRSARGCRRSTSRRGGSGWRAAGRYGFDALLIATGADPVRLPVEGAAESQVHYLRTLRRQPGARRQGRLGEARGRRRRELHRPRGRGVAARARDRRGRRRAGQAAARARPGAGARALVVRGLHEAHGVVFHLGETVSRVDGRAVTLERRTAAGRRLPGPGRGRAPVAGARRAGGPRARPRHRRRRVPRDERAGRLRGGRHRALARSALRRADPRRALGGRRAPGSGGGEEHARPARAVRRGAVLLEPALRHPDQLRRPRREVGRGRDRRGLSTRSTAR